jgi:Fe-S-cluster containining protein
MKSIAALLFDTINQMQSVNKDEFSSCTCEICRNACKSRPGWFVPEQIPEIEEFFGKKIPELLGKELAIDWGTEIEMKEHILLLAPNLEKNASIQYPAVPNGTCVFFKEGKCTIYPIRPYECGVAVHTDSTDVDLLRHIEIATRWKHNPTLAGYRETIICHQPSFADLFGKEAGTQQDKYLDILKKHQPRK